MSYPFADLAFTDAVKAMQEKLGSRRVYAAAAQEADRDFKLDGDVRAFIESRDHFFMATVSETGWPYVQHRGGPAGFVQVLDERRFALGDYVGNRQYVSLGNLSGNKRAAFIFMDYPARARLKAMGEVEIVTREKHPDLIARLTPREAKAAPDRAFVVTVRALDWNCPKYITPRFTEAELAQALAPMRARLEALEAENAALKGK